MKKNNRISSEVLIIMFLVLNSAGIHSNAAADDFMVRAQARVENHKQYILLVWTSKPNVTAYNIYSTHDTMRGYSETPINRTPIKSYDDRSQIESTLRRGSEDWRIITNVLFPPELNFNPCVLGSIQEKDRERLNTLAQIYWRIALVAGLAIIDSTTNVNEEVFYRVCSSDANGNMISILKENITVFYDVVQSPDKINAKAGDSEVLLSWKLTQGASYFAVYRSPSSVIRVQRVNENPIIPSFINKYTINRITDPDMTFLDYQRWNDLGVPISHYVQGVLINGPVNGRSYNYSVTAFDLWGRESVANTFCLATPYDTTRPLPPTQINIITKGVSDSLEIRWVTVTRDIRGHIEAPPISGYYVYRYPEAPDANLRDGVRVGELIPHEMENTTFSAYDSSRNLRPKYGEKIFWYRVTAVDKTGNISMYSSPASGHLKDKWAPMPPTGTQTRGFVDSIKISWDLNFEEDMSGYNVYRSYCHLGAWVECEEESTRSWDLLTGIKNYLPCSGPFGLISTISQDSAKRLMQYNNGKPFIIDRTVPPGSPICYAYLVKAFDLTGNLSGQYPLPDILNEEIVCQHLLDGTPPEPAVISALLSRDSTIKLNWVGPPNQDIVGYHVYRSENEFGPYIWIGGNFVSPLLSGDNRMIHPYEVPVGIDTGCQVIPLEPWPEASIGDFQDSVDPNKIYWYKVAGIDFSGNESSLENTVPVSTFTFSTAHATPKWEISVVQNEMPCGLKISWLPEFNPKSIQGFAVFRATKKEGPFIQRGSILTTNSFIDTDVITNKKYYYRILLYDTESRASEPSYYEEGTIIR